MSSFLLSLPLWQNAMIFALLAGGVWLAGARLTFLADALSERLKLARSIVGLVFLALATSLPEIATTFSAAIDLKQELVLNNLFGGIVLQTAVLALADLWSRSAISNYPRKANHALEAILIVFLLALLLVILILPTRIQFGWVSLGSIILGVSYVGALFLLRKYDDSSDWIPVDLPSQDQDISPLGPAFDPSKTSVPQLLGLSILLCVVILVLGIFLVSSAEVISDQSGLGSSYVGAVFLAAATSLPEVSTTITAVRLGAYTLAISNIFGSNLIMIVLVLPADIAFASGPILNGVSQSVLLAIALGILVTSIYLVGLIIRRKPRIGRLGIDSAFVLLIYVISLGLFYLVS